MKRDIETTSAGHQYAAAYAAQYKVRDLPYAFTLYRQLLETHPDALEADDAQTQIDNIVAALVPKEELQEARLRLLLTHLEVDSRCVGLPAQVPALVPA